MSYLIYLSFFSYSFRVWGLCFRFALLCSGVIELTLVMFSMKVPVFYMATRYICSTSHHRFSEGYINVPWISTLVGVNDKIFGFQDYSNTFFQMGALSQVQLHRGILKFSLSSTILIFHLAHTLGLEEMIQSSPNHPIPFNCKKSPN